MSISPSHPYQSCVTIWQATGHPLPAPIPADPPGCAAAILHAPLIMRALTDLRKSYPAILTHPDPGATLTSIISAYISPIPYSEQHLMLSLALHIGLYAYTLGLEHGRYDTTAPNNNPLCNHIVHN